MRPDLAIIGAPKSGTSSIYAWLSKISGVCCSIPKETFFFMDAKHPLKNASCNIHAHGIDAFRKFFPKKINGRTLDATTHYLYQQTAIDQFSTADTKVCVVLRNPAKRVLSYFEYICLTRAAVKSPIEFDCFVDELLSGNANRFKDNFYEDREFYSLATSLDQGCYLKYIRRWLDKVPKGRFKIIVFEQLISNQEQALRSLADFFELTIPDDHPCVLPKENQKVNYRFPWLNRMVRRVAKHMANLPIKSFLRDVYYILQSHGRAPLPPGDHREALKKLTDYYYDKNIALADAFHLDLSCWRI